MWGIRRPWVGSGRGEREREVRVNVCKPLPLVDIPVEKRLKEAFLAPLGGET